ncbi:hypothetical protein GS429_02390 [Natronorubrum sp. JWXQ-INN-674]|uniref:Uncharacterized protein n=1 Tax=Natronorubrum halalkaliphilum TaxID=2691917 RepID=A0A6B0VJ15_9EURY|nr:hypothetical protein [Natronorubrum halalkaliphilum]MXV60936.1 hypothetical protein [Natronorubrum halalkaliphilum]
MTAIDAAIVFGMSLLVGTVAIVVGVRLLLDRDAGIATAAMTALVGAAVWAGASYLVGWIPLLGVVLMLVTWIGVINWFYPGGWGTAAGIGIVAWLVAVGLVSVAAQFGVVTPEVLGVPGL